MLTHFTYIDIPIHSFTYANIYRNTHICLSSQNAHIYISRDSHALTYTYPYAYAYTAYTCTHMLIQNTCLYINGCLCKNVNISTYTLIHSLCICICSHITHRSIILSTDCPVGWGCRIHRLLLCRGVRPPTTSVLYMILNYLMVRFQQCWSFGESGVSLHCHCSQVHSGPYTPEYTVYTHTYMLTYFTYVFEFWGFCPFWFYGILEDI